MARNMHKYELKMCVLGGQRARHGARRTKWCKIIRNGTQRTQAQRAPGIFSAVFLGLLGVPTLEICNKKLVIAIPKSHG